LVSQDVEWIDRTEVIVWLERGDDDGEVVERRVECSRRELGGEWERILGLIGGGGGGGRGGEEGEEARR
jgi:hypothetical protein